MRHIVEDRHKSFSLFGEFDGAVAVDDCRRISLFVLTDCAEQDNRRRAEVAFERFDILVVDESQIFFLYVGIIYSRTSDDDAVFFSDRDVTALQIFLFREHIRVFFDVCNNQFVHTVLLTLSRMRTTVIIALSILYQTRTKNQVFIFAAMRIKNAISRRLTTRIAMQTSCLKKRRRTKTCADDVIA